MMKNILFNNKDNENKSFIKVITQNIINNDIDNIKFIIDSSTKEDCQELFFYKINLLLCPENYANYIAINQKKEDYLKFDLLLNENDFLLKEKYFFDINIFKNFKNDTTNFISILAFYNEIKIIIDVIKKAFNKDNDKFDVNTINVKDILSFSLLYDNEEMFDFSCFVCLLKDNYLQSINGFPKKSSFQEQYTFYKNNNCFHFNIIKNNFYPLIDKLLMENNIFPEKIIKNKIVPNIQNHKKYQSDITNTFVEMLTLYFNKPELFNDIVSKKYSNKNKSYNDVIINLVSKVIAYDLDESLINRIYKIDNVLGRNKIQLGLYQVFSHINYNNDIKKILSQDKLKQNVLDFFEKKEGRCNYPIALEALIFIYNNSSYYNFNQLFKQFKNNIEKINNNSNNKNIIDKRQNILNNMKDFLLYLSSNNVDFYNYVKNNQNLLNIIKKNDKENYAEFEKKLLNINIFKSQIIKKDKKLL